MRDQFEAAQQGGRERDHRSIQGRKRYREFFLNSRLLKKAIQQGRREWGD
jgi:hypothetical protein